MPKSQIQITQNVRNMLDDAKKRVLTFYSREDFVNYLTFLNGARSAKTSDFGTYKRQLVYMFNARDIEGYEEILKESFDANSEYGKNKVKSILEKVPTRDEIISQLVQEMYELYSQFPSAQNYMEQLVCLLSGNNSDEPLRLKILKQFLRNTDYHTDYIIKIIEKKLTPAERQKYDTANTREAKREIILANIEDSIFEEENYLSFSEWQKFFSNWLKRINMSPFNVTVNFVPDENSTTEEIEKQFYNRLKDNYNLVSDGEINIAPLKIADELRTKIQTTLPEMNQLTDAQIVLQLATVQNFVFQKEDEANLTSELIKSTSTYLKQFNIVRNGKKKTVGEIFKQAVKDKRKNASKGKRENQDTTLLKISQKLADIDFTPQDKKMLYLFAFAFDMEYGGAVKERNIENLFEKVFSANSFKNFVASNDFRLNCEGINIKNYVEVSYLWWLNQKKFSTAERLQEAEKFIDDCFKDAKNKQNQLLTQSKSTDFYKGHIDGIFALNQDNFKQFLLNNYYIYSNNPSQNNNRILMAPLRNTARQKFIELAQKIHESFDPIHKVTATTDREGNIDKQGKKIYDADNKVEYDEVEIESLLPEDNYPKEFQNLLKKLNEAVQIGKHDFLDEEKILEIEESLEKLSKIFQVDKNIILNEDKILEIKALLEKLSEIFKIDKNIVLDEKKIPAIKKSLENLTKTLKTILEFQKLLKKLNEKVQVGKRDLLDVKKITNLKNFNRTDLIALYYSYFAQSKLPDFQDDSTLGVVDWESLYNTFTEELDTYLTDCHFQPFNAKNLYDQFIFLALMLEILK